MGGRNWRPETGNRLPKALACGMLEDGGRVLFLVRTDRSGTERIELPCVLVPSGRSPFAEIKEAFGKQTGIADYEVHEVVLEGRHNAGSRRRRMKVPALVFKITARVRTAKVAPEFSGFRWLSLEDAKSKRWGRDFEWFFGARKPSEE
ncbi:MAG: hypothetical protein AB1295_04880 [Candidatus Micrarchaeota archaeon]